MAQIEVIEPWYIERSQNAVAGDPLRFENSVYGPLSIVVTSIFH